jgi:hypothetical protein
LEDRMENPPNFPILSHLTHTAVFSNRNIPHYLQRIVARYRNSRSCCEVQVDNRPSRSLLHLYLEHFVFIVLLSYFNYVSYTLSLTICITTLIATDLRVIKVAHISFTP